MASGADNAADASIQELPDETLYWALIDIANGLLSGTLLGGYYAVISIGLAVSFGVMRLVNLAHGDWLIVAAYVAVVFTRLLPVSPFITLLLVVPVMWAVGYWCAALSAQPGLGTGDGGQGTRRWLRADVAHFNDLRAVDFFSPRATRAVQRRQPR